MASVVVIDGSASNSSISHVFSVKDNDLTLIFILW